ncbi:immunity 49 family protein [Flavobacterium sp. RHBU_3]|uniref:immunity 49 family protein n=1 Tax=Flavobacterium sp. RHBU_3 TaxID=3391184 RepID=UPI0039847AFF
MKNVLRHKVDKPEAVTLFYNSLENYYQENITGYRKKFRYLFYTFKESAELLETSVLEKPQLSLQKKWFNYGLNCISEFCRLAHFVGEEREVKIDDEDDFIIKVEEVNEHVNLFKALCLSSIARDKVKQRIIAESPKFFWGIKEEDFEKETFGICFLKLIKEFYLTGNINISLFEATQKDLIKNKNLIGPDVKQKFWIFMMSKYLDALKSLAENDEAAFNANLIAALEAHKAVWSQKKALNRGGTPLCRENEGFLSWGCTALAAMAYDKGWKQEIESDYMPQFMVDGSINK